MRRVGAVALVWTVAVLAALAGGVVGSAAASADAPASAWYWSLSPAPVPPYATEGTLLVEGRPTGPTAVAAARATVPTSVVGVSLVLRLREGSIGVDDAVVLACSANGEWKEGAAQAWSDRPPGACENGVPGVLSGDGATMTFGITSLVVDGRVDVLLTPGTTGTGATGIGGSTFSAVFDEPDEAAFVVTTAPAAPSRPLPQPAGPSFAAGPPSFDAHPAPGQVTSAPPSEVMTTVPRTANGEVGDRAVLSTSMPRPSGTGWIVLAVGVPLALLAWRSRDVVAVLARTRRLS